MPIENERKFVLNDDGNVEPRLAKAPDVTSSFLRQAYLDAPGLRIRSVQIGREIKHIFTYKREIAGQVVEIETEIAAPSPVRSRRTSAARIPLIAYMPAEMSATENPTFDMVSSPVTEKAPASA